MLLEAPSPGEYPWAWISVDNNLLLVVTRKGKLLIDEVDKKTTLLKEALPRVSKDVRSLQMENTLWLSGRKISEGVCRWSVLHSGRPACRHSFIRV